MASFIKLQIDRAMNRNSMLSVTVIDPEHEVSDKLVEGRDIVVPLFEGVAFSGMIVQVNREQLTHDGAATHHYMWEVEAVSDEVKLSRELIPEIASEETLTMTSGELVEEYIGDDWIGDIYIGGPPYTHSSLPVDKASAISDLSSQTGFDYMTRRDYLRYKVRNITVLGFVAMIYLDWCEEGVVGNLLMFVSGLGAFKSYGRISARGVLPDDGGIMLTVPLSEINLPKKDDSFIIINHPVVDFKPSIGEGASVKTFIANSTIIDFSDVDNKKSLVTRVICTGVNYSGEAISSSLVASCKDWSEYTYTTYRGDGILAISAYEGDEVLYVVGHLFRPEVDDHVVVRSMNDLLGTPLEDIDHIITSTGRALTKLSVIRVGMDMPSGSDVMCLNYGGDLTKIYVDNASLLEGSDTVYIGQESMELESTGVDDHGDYILVNRGLFTAYGHPVGVLVRPSDDIHEESPVAIYGDIPKVVQTSNPCSRGDLDRLCSSILPQASRGSKSGEGIVPLNQFWKIDNKTSPGYVPLEPGDVVTVRQGGIDTDYVLVSYKIDFDKMRVSVKLGDYGENLASKVRAIQQTLNRKLS